MRRRERDRERNREMEAGERGNEDVEGAEKRAEFVCRGQNTCGNVCMCMNSRALPWCVVYEFQRAVGPRSQTHRLMRKIPNVVQQGSTRACFCSTHNDPPPPTRLFHTALNTHNGTCGGSGRAGPSLIPVSHWRPHPWSPTPTPLQPNQIPHTAPTRLPLGHGWCVLSPPLSPLSSPHAH